MNNHSRSYAQIITAAVLTFTVLTAGCSGLITGGEAPTPESTDVPITQTEEQPKTESGNSIQTTNLTDEEIEYLESTTRLGEWIGLHNPNHTHTTLHKFRGSPNNVLAFSTQTKGDVPLERSVMDGAQIVAAATYVKSKESKSEVDNVTSTPVHEPDLVKINLYGPDDNLLVYYEVNPALAREYRQGNISVRNFSQSVMDSVEVRTQYDNRGERPPEEYLNRSELEVWTSHYARELHNSDGPYDKPFPIDSIRANGSRFEVLHEFEYSLDEYGIHIASAKTTAFASYLRLYMKSWARFPERMNVFAQVTDADKNLVSHMDKENVMEVLKRNATRQALVQYQNNESVRWIDKDENPFEDF